MTKFMQIENELTADRVYKELKNAILRNILKPGQKLDIFELAEQFNVSRTPVKEAFNRLHLEGLLMIKPRKGTYVAEIDLRKVIEVLDARLLFETWAAKVGVLNATAEEIQYLRTLCFEMDQIYATEPFDYSSFNELDIRFHYHIVKMGQNQCIMDLYKGLNAHRITERAYYEVAFQKANSGHYQHHEIVDAFEKRDEALVIEWITQHIQAGKSELSSVLK